MKKLLIFTVMIIAISMVFGCTPRLDSNGCFGYTYDAGLKRGTLTKNQMYSSPYRLCVEKEKPHRNLERRPNG